MPPYRHLVLAAVCASGLLPPAAAAHSELVESRPAADDRVSPAPDTVTLRFSEPLRQALRLRVADSRGRDRVAAVRFDRRTPRLVRGALRPLRPGRYRVTWAVVAADGYTQGGSFAFRVTRPR